MDGGGCIDPIRMARSREQLCLAAFILVGARVLWLGGRGHNVDVFTGKNLDIPAAESDAMLQSLARYDRALAEARIPLGAELGGNPDPAHHPVDPTVRVDARTDRGFEAKTAARMKERGRADPPGGNQGGACGLSPASGTGFGVPNGVEPANERYSASIWADMPRVSTSFRRTGC
jgi:hypothetical protein